MPFASKEFISVLSRNKSSEKSVCLLTRGILLGCTPTDPRLRKKKKIKFFLNQGRLELNSGIYDDVQVQRSKRLAVLTPLPLYYS